MCLASYFNMDWHLTVTPADTSLWHQLTSHPDTNWHLTLTPHSDTSLWHRTLTPMFVFIANTVYTILYYFVSYFKPAADSFHRCWWHFCHILCERHVSRYSLASLQEGCSCRKLWRGNNSHVCSPRSVYSILCHSCQYTLPYLPVYSVIAASVLCHICQYTLS